MGGLGALPTGSGGVPSSVSPVQFLFAQVNRFKDAAPAFRFLDGVGGQTFTLPPKTKTSLDPTNPEDRRLALVVAAIVQRREAEAFTQGLSSYMGDDEGNIFASISDFLIGIQNTVTGKPGATAAPISSGGGGISIFGPGEGGGFADPVGFVNRQIPQVAVTVQGFADSLGLPKAKISIFSEIPMVAVGAVAITGVVALFWWTANRKGRK